MKPPPSARLIRGHRLAQGLVFFPPFNEGSGGQVFDSSGNENNGTGTLTWGAGKFGPYVNSGIITVQDSPVLDGTATMSWSFWIKPSSSADIIFLDKYTAVGGKRSWHIQRKADADLVLRVSSDGNGNEEEEWNDANIPNGVWTHVIITFDNGIAHLYKNGIFIETETFATHTSIFAGSDNFLIDCSNQGLDVPMIYNRVLSASEAAELYWKSFCMLERKARIALLSGYAAPPVGNAGIMTTNTGFWGPTF